MKLAIVRRYSTPAVPIADDITQITTSFFRINHSRMVIYKYLYLYITIARENAPVAVHLSNPHWLCGFESVLRQSLSSLLPPLMQHANSSRSITCAVPSPIAVGCGAAFCVDPRMAVAQINSVRLASSDTKCCAGRYFTPFPFRLQFVNKLPLSSIMTNEFES